MINGRSKSLSLFSNSSLIGHLALLGITLPSKSIPLFYSGTFGLFCLTNTNGIHTCKSEQLSINFRHLSDVFMHTFMD